MVDRALFSSATTEWATPQDFFDKLHREFNFVLDPCATAENAKCAMFFTHEDNGLIQPWHPHKRVFMNPPYGSSEHPCKSNCKKQKCKERGHCITEYIPGIEDWVRKAYEEHLKGCTVVCLLPARTCTHWFHEYVYSKASEIRFVRGRLRFGGATNSAPFPSMVVVYSRS